MQSTPITTATEESKQKPVVLIESWLVSVIIHTIVLLALGLWALPKAAGHITESLKARFDTRRHETLEFSVPAAFDLPNPSTEPDQQLVEVEASRPQRFDVVRPDSQSELTIGSALTSLLRPTRDAAMTSLIRPTVGMSGPIRSISASTDGVRQAAGVADATGMVAESIRSELAKGDTLVVWLLDSSVSLEVHRATLAKRAAEFYESIGGMTNSQPADDADEDRYRLFSSVIGFGEHSREVLTPTPVGSKAIRAIRNVPRDTTGTENVMKGIEYAIKLYRDKRHRHERLMIVVLTDEAGDDTVMLESSIKKCREARVAVHVMAATSVMGIENGIQHCVINQKGVNYSFWLDVKKGPESLYAQRFYLPYWHESTLPPWRNGGAQAVENAEWYGGPYRERVLSGFGPYALTRLALQSGGTITVFDHVPGETGFYDVDLLRPYTPDYGSPTEYSIAVQRSPLRRFVTEASELSFNYSQLFVPPRMVFIGARSSTYPYPVRHRYFSPAAFRDHLSAALQIERNRIKTAREKLVGLARRMQAGEIDWDQEFDQEQSKRWQAWFDLTRGRLLSNIVRYDEYLAATESDTMSLGQNANAITLRPTKAMRLNTSNALVAQATAYLNRCIEKNESTPWADLARWELDQPWGIAIEPSVIPKPAPRALTQPMRSMPATRQTFQFPNL